MQKNLAIKLSVIAAIVLSILIPLSMVQSKMSERKGFKQEAKANVAKSWTGEQLLMTPILVQPYTVEFQGHIDLTNREASLPTHVTRYQIVLPKVLEQHTDVSTDMRRKGIYTIPVYSSLLEVNGTFEAAMIREKLKALSQLPEFVAVKEPYVAIYISDPRGIDSLPEFKWQDRAVSFSPGSGLPFLSDGIHARVPELSGESDGDIHFHTKLALRGMESLRIIPAGLEARFGMRSPWPHPMFDGAFLPSERKVGQHGFEASWHINHFSSGVTEKITTCTNGDCSSLTGTSFGVSLIEPVDVYSKSERSIKYALLFVGLSFIAFFMFEIMKGLRIHPIQYALVGLAIAIFYLLLISLSEHISFAIAYSVAACFCVVLISYYVWHVLRDLRGTWLFTGMLCALYALLYVIIQEEDYALLMGAALVFVILGMVMVLTRNIDWYEMSEKLNPPKTLT